MLRIGFIGAGKVGCTLGKYFVTEKRSGTGEEISLAGYYSKNLQSARDAAVFTGTAVYETIEALVAECSLIFLTVPDDAIESVWGRLKSLLIAGKIICHCSGSLSSGIFSGCKESGAFAYSVHPLFAVSSKTESYKTFSQAFFTVEGDFQYRERLCGFLRSFGNRVEVIAANVKTKYHAAAVLASNHIIALMQTATELLLSCGFSEDSAEKALAPLVFHNIQTLLRDGSQQSLTGPVERNDIGTVRKHLQSLDGNTKQLYCMLSEILVTIAQRKHPQRDYSNMLNILHDMR